MALIDALKRQLEHAQNLLTEIDEKRAKLNADYHEQWHYVADLDTAIAALEPTTKQTSSPHVEEANVAPFVGDDQHEVLKPLLGGVEESREHSSDCATHNEPAMANGECDCDKPTEHISTLTGDPAVEPESGLHGELFAGKPYRVYVQTGLSGGGNYFDTLDEAQAYADALIILPGVMLVRVQDCSDADQTVDLFVWPREEAAPADPEPTELDAEPYKLAWTVTGGSHTNDGTSVSITPNPKLDAVTLNAMVGTGEQLAEDIEQPTELDAPASIVDDPELQAAVARAEATLAKDEPAYVGLQDADLDAEWDAMKAREEAEKPKPRFSIFGRIKEDA